MGTNVKDGMCSIILEVHFSSVNSFAEALEVELGPM